MLRKIKVVLIGELHSRLPLRLLFNPVPRFGNLDVPYSRLCRLRLSALVRGLPYFRRKIPNPLLIISFSVFYANAYFL